MLILWCQEYPVAVQVNVCVGDRPKIPKIIPWSSYVQTDVRYAFWNRQGKPLRFIDLDCFIVQYFICHPFQKASIVSPNWFASTKSDLRLIPASHQQQLVQSFLLQFCDRQSLQPCIYVIRRAGPVENQAIFRFVVQCLLHRIRQNGFGSLINRSANLRSSVCLVVFLQIQRI